MGILVRVETDTTFSESNLAIFIKHLKNADLVISLRKLSGMHTKDVYTTMYILNMHTHMLQCIYYIYVYI